MFEKRAILLMAAGQIGLERNSLPQVQSASHRLHTTYQDGENKRGMTRQVPVSPGGAGILFLVKRVG